ncbi:MAG: enoyl-CoA hydratase/carnithine racemase [Halieaceae bacterium]|jgi:enoyl-CoA hydratase/carnithine racemase
MSNSLLSSLENGVLHLTLNRPEKKNAIDDELWFALRDALVTAMDNPAVRCVLLSGAGGNFCAGVDLSSFNVPGDIADQPFHATERALIAFDKPLIGAAAGVAVGGGATILFHCDVLYVGENLRMRLPFASLGLVPEFASSYLLQANIGARRAAELFYTAEWIDADRALETGIATRVYSDDDLLRNALKKAEEIAQWPVTALQETKRCLKAAHSTGIESALKAEHKGTEKQAGSPENIEAIMAFFEKRPADFEKLI